MSSAGDRGRVRRRVAARLSRPNASSNSFTPLSSAMVPSPTHAWRASSARWNDGSAAATPPPAAQRASCSRSPRAAAAAAMSTGAMSPVVTPQRPTAICPS
eukprot:1838446-Pleurochrysis_carterae.AAC.1